LSLEWESMKKEVDEEQRRACLAVRAAILQAPKQSCGCYPLASPVINPLYYGTDFACVEILLDLDYKTVNSIIHHQAYVVFDRTENLSKERLFLKIINAEESKRIAGDRHLEAETGAEAIRRLLQNLDIKKMLAVVNEELSVEKRMEQMLLYGVSGSKDYSRLRLRRNILRFFEHNKIDPAWIVMDTIPIVPIIEKTHGAPTDLLMLYANLMTVNTRLSRLIQLNAPAVILSLDKKKLQDRYDAIIHNGCFGVQPIAMWDDGVKMKSLMDILNGRTTERIEYRDDMVYWGTTRKGKREGIGILSFPGKYYYIGQFCNDNITGYGKIYYAEGGYYEGEFSNGMKNGKGTLSGFCEPISGMWKNDSYIG